jgi:thiol:disulfide interchange protein
MGVMREQHTGAERRRRGRGAAIALVFAVAAAIAGCSHPGGKDTSNAKVAAEALAAVQGAAASEGLVHWVPRDSAEERSRATGKPVLYDFSAAWCGPCRLMGKDVFANEARARAIDSLFVPVHIVDRQREDGKNEPEIDALMERFRIEAFPTLVAYDPESGKKDGIEGYAGPEATIRQLEEIRGKLK